MMRRDLTPVPSPEKCHVPRLTCHVKSLLGTWHLALGTLLILALCLPSIALADAAASKNNRGNKLYREKKYGEALERYREAQLEAPKSPQIHFNTGDALFQAQEFDQAAEAYSKALALGMPDRALEGQTHYNLGNCFYKKDKFSEAVASYRRALALKPDDRDFKFNLELAQEKLKTQQQAQNQQGQQDQKKQDQDKQDQKDRQNDPKQGPQDKQNSQEPQDQKKQEAPRPGELSRQEAERVLDAVEGQEREAQKKRQVAITGRRYTGEEW